MTEPGRFQGPITRLLADDHDRLDALLRDATARPGEVAREPFDLFRAGLLRHIALEEKILFRAVREAGGDLGPLQRRLRVDHGAISSLLVPTPTAELVRELRSILEPHNALEEAPEGLYARCDALLAGRADALLEELRAYPPVKVAGYRDGPRVLRTAAAALESSAAQGLRTPADRAQGRPDEAAPAPQGAPNNERGFAASTYLERGGGSGGASRAKRGECPPVQIDSAAGFPRKRP